MHLRKVLVVALVAGSLLLVGAPGPVGAAAPPERGSGFEPSTRAAAEALFNQQYTDTHDGLLNWTGSVSGCQDGTTGDLFKEGVLNRINYFRAMAGVPDDIVFTPAANAAAHTPGGPLSLPGAEFTGATVTMTRNGNPISVTELTPQAGYGLPSLVWEPTTNLTTAADFHVSVTGITGVGVPSSISYDVHTFVPDQTPPTADVRTPAAGVVYPQGTPLTADFDCADTGGSGLASCTGTISDGQPLDTTTLGTHPFSVTASDGAGLLSIVDRPYTVAQRPDLAASVGAAGAVVGDGLYATTVVPGQTVTAPVARGATRTFVARLGNDAGTTASFRLRAGGTATRGFTLKIVRDGVDITAAVLAGTYPVNDLAPGATVSVKVKVTATTTSTSGAARNVDLTLSSTAGPSAKDKVRVRAVRS